MASGAKAKKHRLKIGMNNGFVGLRQGFFFYIVSLNYLRPTARLNEFCWWVRFSNGNESNKQGILKHCRSNIRNYVKEITVISVVHMIKGYTCIYKIKMTCNHAPRDIWSGFEWKAFGNEVFCYSWIILEKEEEMFYFFVHFS